MPSPSLFEPLFKLAQSNVETWTQFLMAPDQPWSPGKVDLFGSRPTMPSLVPAADSLTRLWNGLMENQNRFIAEWTQRSGDALATLPQQAVTAATR
jgi:hypothetical protein